VKQAYHHKDLRNALIDEALAMLATDGPSELTLRELARRLGVTHAAPYAHFPDKRRLLEAVHDAGFSRLADQLEAAAREAEEPVVAFRRMAFTYLQFAAENPNLYRLMFSSLELRHEPDGEMSPDGERAFSTLVRTVERVGVPSGVDTHDLAAAVWAMVHGVAMLEIDGRLNTKTAHDPQAVLSLMTDVAIRGLGGGAAD
jgi:AcrR family transcriptional regulator